MIRNTSSAHKSRLFFSANFFRRSKPPTHQNPLVCNMATNAGSIATHGATLPRPHKVSSHENLSHQPPGQTATLEKKPVNQTYTGQGIRCTCQDATYGEFGCADCTRKAFDAMPGSKKTEQQPQEATVLSGYEMAKGKVRTVRDLINKYETDFNDKDNLVEQQISDLNIERSKRQTMLEMARIAR